MSDLEIHRFTPTDDDDVRASFEITNAVSAADSPWEHPWLAHRFRRFLERGWDGEPPACYLASVDGTPVGSAFVFTSERDNTHLAWLWLAILPEHRRRGYGTALFERLVEEVRAARPHQRRHRRLGVRAGARASPPGTVWSAGRRRSCGASTWPSSSPAACSGCTTRRPPPRPTTSWSGSPDGRRPSWSTRWSSWCRRSTTPRPTTSTSRTRCSPRSGWPPTRTRPWPAGTGSTGWWPGTGGPASSAATPWSRSRSSDPRSPTSTTPPWRRRTGATASACC